MSVTLNEEVRRKSLGESSWTQLNVENRGMTSKRKKDYKRSKSSGMLKSAKLNDNCQNCDKKGHLKNVYQTSKKNKHENNTNENDSYI